MQGRAVRASRGGRRVAPSTITLTMTLTGYVVKKLRKDYTNK